MFEVLEKYAGFAIYPLIAVFLSALLTWMCIRILPALGYVDKPGGRHIHKTLVPRGGGIAVIASFFIAFGLYVLENRGIAAGGGEFFLRMFVPAVLLGAVCMVDDRHELKSWVKLGAQLVVVFIIWLSSNEITIFGYEVPVYWSLIGSMVWSIIVINAFNLIDGLDGLASGLAIVSAICLTIWFLMVGGHTMEAMAMLVLAGSCLGFLRYNFHPAKIFLGDTGSTFLGLIFAFIGLNSIDRVVTMTSLLLPLLAIGVPIFDVVLAIWRRSSRKLLDPQASGIMDGDQDHLHHRLLRQTKKQTTTAIFMYLLACGFSLVGLMFIFLKDLAPAVAYVILLIAVLIVIRQLAGVELLNSARVIQNGLAKPRRGLLVNITQPFVDFMLIGLSFLISSSLAFGGFRDFKVFIYMFAPLALVLCLSRVYRVYWLRAGLNNYWNLELLIFAGSGFSCLLVYYFCFPQMHADLGVNTRAFWAGSLLFALMNMMFIALERFVVRYAEGFLFRNLYLQIQPPEKLDNVVIYGGGLRCRLYVNELYCAQKNDVGERIVGIIDDDLALRHLHVYGFKVLGTSAELSEIHNTVHFDKVLIATSLINDEVLGKISDFCRKNKIELRRLNIEEEVINAPDNNDGKVEKKRFSD